MTKNKLNKPNNTKFRFVHDFLLNYTIKSSGIHIKLLYKTHNLHIKNALKSGRNFIN